MNNYIKLYGHKYWYLEDDIQRSYKDDVEWINGQLCIKGKLIHREDGPAIEYHDGNIEYWLCNKKFETKEEWEHYRDNYISLKRSHKDKRIVHDDLLDIFD